MRFSSAVEADMTAVILLLDSVKQPPNSDNRLSSSIRFEGCCGEQPHSRRIQFQSHETAEIEIREDRRRITNVASTNSLGRPHGPAGLGAASARHNRSSSVTPPAGAVRGLSSPRTRRRRRGSRPSRRRRPRGTRDVLASGPLDVGRRKLELGAGSVRGAAGAAGGLGAGPLGAAADPAAMSGLTATGKADKGGQRCHAYITLFGSCPRCSAWLAAVTMSRRRARRRSSSNRRRSRSNGGGRPQPAAAATQRDGAAAATRRRTGRLAARSLDVERQHLVLAARPICAAAAWRDDLGAGPLGAAAWRRRLGLAGRALGLTTLTLVS